MQTKPVDSKPLPPVEQVRPGLWSIPVPLPIVLRYVLVYAFETDRGPFIVDAGWNTDVAFDALSAGLNEAGFDMADVQGVMVTHIHPDHYGLAGRIRDTSGAWIALHPADAALIHDRYEEPRRPARADGRLAPPARRTRQRDRRPAERVDAGARVRGVRQARSAPRGRRQARHARAGTSPRCGRPATPPAISASGNRATS